MLDDKLLVQIIKYIELETDYPDKYNLIDKVRYYGYDIFNNNILNEEELKIINEARG